MAINEPVFVLSYLSLQLRAKNGSRTCTIYLDLHWKLNVWEIILLSVSFEKCGFCLFASRKQGIYIWAYEFVAV
jgi:hypothetical protein